METSWQISRRQSIWTNITRSVRYTDIWEQNRNYPLHVVLCVQQYLLILRGCQSVGFWYFLNYWSVMEVRWQISRVQSIRIGELFLYRNVLCSVTKEAECSEKVYRWCLAAPRVFFFRDTCSFIWLKLVYICIIPLCLCWTIPLLTVHKTASCKLMLS